MALPPSLLRWPLTSISHHGRLHPRLDHSTRKTLVQTESEPVPLVSQTLIRLAKHPITLWPPRRRQAICCHCTLPMHPRPMKARGNPHREPHRCCHVACIRSAMGPSNRLDRPTLSRETELAMFWLLSPSLVCQHPVNNNRASAGEATNCHDVWCLG